MTYFVCACGHRMTSHIRSGTWIGCGICACLTFDAELRVSSARLPFDWERDGDLG